MSEKFLGECIAHGINNFQHFIGLPKTAQAIVIEPDVLLVQLKPGDIYRIRIDSPAMEFYDPYADFPDSMEEGKGEGEGEAEEEPAEQVNAVAVAPPV